EGEAAHLRDVAVVHAALERLPAGRPQRGEAGLEDAVIGIDLEREGAAGEPGAVGRAHEHVDAPGQPSAERAPGVAAPAGGVGGGHAADAGEAAGHAEAAVDGGEGADAAAAVDAAGTEAAPALPRVAGGVEGHAAAVHVAGVGEVASGDDAV